ncbi:hypothetical protein SMC26_39655 [Actinomadura fulvescens]|uniref:Uncharacterized protein n=1 Tax=Actinomadura fulvescens TaxID=46160 RepID=A0ABN3QKX4_9ACTN
MNDGSLPPDDQRPPPVPAPRSAKWWIGVPLIVVAALLAMGGLTVLAVLIVAHAALSSWGSNK